MLDTTSISQPLADYAVVRRVIAFVSSCRREQPSIDDVVENVGLTSMRLEQVFERLAGLTVTAFSRAISVEHVRELLRNSAALEDAHPVAPSGSLGRATCSRSVRRSPSARRGDGLVLRYGFHPSPFGEAVVVMGPQGLAGLGFVDDDREAALRDMRRRWPSARLLAERAIRRENETPKPRISARLMQAILKADFKGRLGPRAPMTNRRARCWFARAAPMGAGGKRRASWGKRLLSKALACLPMISAIPNTPLFVY
jgi:AraC-like DNA-binding protein